MFFIRNPHVSTGTVNILLICLIIFSLVTFSSTELSKTNESQDKLDPPKRSFCSGTHNGRTLAGSMNRIQDLKAMYENCTRVSANLEITHLTKETLGWTDKMMDTPLTIFDHIEEIKGYLLIYNVDLSLLSFKNLKIIWGDELLDENTRNGALTISSNHNLKEVRMPRLRTIEKGNVRIENNTYLCYLRDKILWSELLNMDKSRLIAAPSGHKQCDYYKDKIKCHDLCQSGYCWGRKLGDCQNLYRTICPAKCQASNQCYFDKIDDEYKCCDTTCAGGCTGPTANDCLACKEFSHHGVCVSKCPELMVYDRRTATRIPNVNGTYLYDRYCVQQCPEHLLIDGEICVRHCSIGKHHDMTKETRECEKCKGACPKVCNVDQPLTGSILRNLINCEEIDGFISILDSRMSSSDGYTLKDLNVLKTVRMVSEFVLISAVHLSPSNFSFLENLQFIEGRQLSNRRYALEITKNDLLVSLDLKSLKTIKNGHVIITENVGLCYAASVDWKPILAKNAVARVEDNQAKEKCIKRGRVCDKQCDDSSGCWGKGPTKCLNCRNWSLKGECVAECPKHGFYKNITSKECLPCYDLCLECLGPSETECTSCRGVSIFDQKYETLTCLSECPKTHFFETGTCLPCHNSCQEFGCTGLGDHLGEGGCNKCMYALINEYKQVERCLVGTEHNICQDNNLTNYFGALLPIIEGVEKAYCEKCDDECLSCRFGGSSMKKDECLCKNYLVKENNDERCYSQCTTTSYLTREKSDHAFGICEECHSLCDRNHGCTGGFPTQCVKCARASIEIDGETICLPVCPEEAPFQDEPDPSCHAIDMQSQRRRRTIYTTLAFFALFILAVTIVLRVLYRNRRIQKRLNREIYENSPKVPESIEMSVGYEANLNKVNVIPISDLRSTGKILGEGAFGVVCAGFYFVKGERKAKLPVAIKLLKSSGAVTAMEEMQMLEEATTMARLKHPNLLGLMGICFSSEGLQLVTVLRPLGDLLKFLRKHKNHLAGKDLLLYCYQIACAMRYLYDHRIVHRDLAARNVLVKTPQHIQVTDFGLSKLLKYGENKVTISGKIALKWTALESVDINSFNHATDVWAFGVTCWEILTFGLSPYPRLEMNEVISFLRGGGRLEQPNNCSVELYQVLLQCWVVNPESRPTFVFLQERFQEFCRVPHLYVVLNTGSSVNDISQPTQLDMIRELLPDFDSEFDEILDPEDYQDIHQNVDHDQPAGRRNVRRDTSVGSKRYQPDPISQPILEGTIEDIPEDDGQYLIPTAMKTAEQRAATLYTAIVNTDCVTELGQPNEYYNKPTDYYNCKTDRDNKKDKEQEDVEVESCL